MTSPLVRLLLESSALKSVPRRGWLEHGIDPPDGESVADHTFGTALAVLLVGIERAPDIDLGRALSLALVHDLAEIRTGDVIPSDGVDRAAKHSAERRAFEELVAGLAGAEAWLELFDEYQAGATGEARFVRACDKLEMALQGCRYDQRDAFDAAPFLRSARSGARADSRVSAVLEDVLGAHGMEPDDGTAPNDGRDPA